MENTIPHLGDMLAAHLDGRRARRSVLVRKLGIAPASLNNYQKRQSFQCATLWRLSVELKHNFFADLAAQLPPDYTTTAPKSTAIDEEIAQLKNKIQSLEAEKNMLLEVARGKM